MAGIGRKLVTAYVLFLVTTIALLEVAQADDVCTLKADTGPCRADITRYYYNQEQNACLKFSYGGCQGNKNNFKSVEDCECHCMEDDNGMIGLLPAGQN